MSRMRLKATLFRGAAAEISAEREPVPLPELGEVRGSASHASEVINYLLKVLRSEEEGTAHRLKAGIELLNRGLGLPQAQIDVDVIVRRKISEMSLDELRQLEERLVGSFTSAAPLFLEGQLDPMKQSDG